MNLKYKFNLPPRERKVGKDRMLERQDRMFNNQLAFPKSIGYEDIDLEIKKWVENELEIIFDGEKIPTFNLFSNQRISEYAQTWKHLDQNGNLLMNFKTITRANNPKQGKINGESRNIPGDRYYLIGYKPVTQESGTVGYDAYSMKQPYAVDLEYKISIITNKMLLLNKFNNLIQDKFKAINAYIFPNNHAISLKLEDISDDSEYTLNDRKYYSQVFTIVAKAYIINEDDFKITHLPIRTNIYLNDGITQRKNIKDVEVEYINPCSEPDEENNFRYKQISIKINVTTCLSPFEFEYDVSPSLKINDIELSNIDTFLMYINGELVDFECDVVLLRNDVIKVEFTIIELSEPAFVKIIGDDESVILNTTVNPESAIDEINKNEHYEYTPVNN